ncbi:MAG TPA: DsrE family protein [Gammaproteobacteria bacterium]|nr:DsrE family protein [Gammaproteobacteria bacterium]
MSKYLILVAVFIGIFFSSAVLAGPPTDTWQNPVIKAAGEMLPLPDAAFQPQKSVTYKVLFSITRGNKDPKDAQSINDGLDHVARAINVFASAGVPLDHLKFVVIITGGAVPVVLDNAHYRNQFGIDNPNLTVIKQLEAAGVEIAVCGQALAGYKYEHSWVDPDVKVALSALSTAIILQQQGYSLIPM